MVFEPEQFLYKEDEDDHVRELLRLAVCRDDYLLNIMYDFTGIIIEQRMYLN